MGLLNFVLVAVLTGFMSAIVLSFSTAGIAIMSYRKGLDPCNTTLPASASLGDIVTIIFLIVSVKIVMGLGI